MDLSSYLPAWLLQLVAYFRSDPEQPPQVNKATPILNLPVELLLLIIGSLAWHDKYLLSHTCKDMRFFTRCDWDVEIGRLPTPERSAFYAGLAYSSPDHYACATRFMLHRIDLRDVPTSKGQRCCSRRLAAHDRYHLQHHHVQLALKYSRLGNVNQQYFRRLMAPYTQSFDGGWCTMALRPKVAHGRFLLNGVWMFGNHMEVLSPTDIGDHGLALCSHRHFIYMGLWSRHIRHGRRPSLGLQQAILHAFVNPGIEHYHHCKRCPMDYSIHVSDSKTSVIFKTWHDFGGHDSSVQSIWLSQTGAIASWQAPRRQHLPGTVRRLYTGR